MWVRGHNGSDFLYIFRDTMDEFNVHGVSIIRCGLGDGDFERWRPSIEFVLRNPVYRSGLSQFECAEFPAVNCLWKHVDALRGRCK